MSGSRLALRLGILARLADVGSLATSAPQVGERAAAVLRRNDADHPLVWLLEVADGRLQQVSTADPQARHSAAAHAVGVAALGSLTHVVHRVDDGIAELHAVPVIEPGQEAASLVLVLGTSQILAGDAGFEDYLQVASGIIGAGLSGQRDLAKERQRSESLRELDQAKSAFLADLSHELRTPIALVFGPLQDVLANPDAEYSVTRGRLLMIRDNVARLNRMVDAMLDFSRMEAGRISPQLVGLDLAALLRSLAAAFAPAFERSDVRFDVVIGEEPMDVVSDRDIVERIVLNLLSNALKYTLAGRVSLELRAADGWFEIEVADTGIGIPVKDHERVFARFERLPRPEQSRSTEGAGIGLAMVAELTALLGGTVGLRSAPGRGSTFTVRMPVLAVAGGDGEAITPRGVDAFLADIRRWERPVELHRLPGRPRLLIAEDSPDMARYLAESLGSDYEIELVADGLAALAAARARRPDAVLSDVMMPGLDGIALVSEIRADPSLRDLPVLLLSARAGGEDTASGLEHGADDYVAKPFSLTDLKARLASNIVRSADRSMDAGWRRAVLEAIAEAMIIADETGAVTELNEAFTRMLGWRLEDGPFTMPYPWWPDPQQYPEERAAIEEAHTNVLEAGQIAGEYLLQHRDGRFVWASYLGGVVEDRHGRVAVLKTLRDSTREHQARSRRRAVARVSADFASADQLDQLVASAVYGLRHLFEGEVVVQFGSGDAVHLFDATGPVGPDQVPGPVLALLNAGEPSGEAEIPEGGRPVERLLLAPQGGAGATRACVAFARPRVVGPDEQIVADMLAQSLALAVDRVLAAGEFADRQANLERAMESHRLIGQAVGILVERHRLTSDQAFAALRRASQDRNIRLRILAQRVIDTGLDPAEA